MMDQQQPDANCDESLAEEEASERREQTSKSDDYLEDTLLHLADLVSEDESSSRDESSQLRKRRASRDAAQAERKDRDTPTPKHKRRKRDRNKLNKTSAKGKMVLRPNYFVGIQVSNPEVHRAVRSVQERIVGLEPALRSTVVPTPLLHVTLAVAHLPDTAHVAKAAEVMKQSVSVNRELYNHPPVRLTFTGIKTFRNQVLFADIEGGESLLRVAGLARAIQESFEESGLVLPSKKRFQPHLTILKLSKDFKLKRKGELKITPSLYSGVEGMQFGEQVVRSVQLLSMYKPKDASGYYYCSHEETFGVDHEESNDHSGCCKKLFPSKPLVAVVTGTSPGPCANARRRLHGLAATEERPSTEDVIKLLLLVGAASIGAAFLLRSFSSAK